MRKIKNIVFNFILSFFVFSSLFCSIANAQDKDRIGLSIKVQSVPSIGISYSLSNHLKLRPSLYLFYSDGDILDSIIGSLGIFYSTSKDSSFFYYCGPNLTYSGHGDDFFLGMILGSELSLHRKVGIFGEFGIDLQLGDGIEGISFFNTGIGLVYYFK